MFEEDGGAGGVRGRRRKGVHQVPRRREVGAYGAGLVVVAVGVLVAGVGEDEDGRVHGGGGKDRRERRRDQPPHYINTRVYSLYHTVFQGCLRTINIIYGRTRRRNFLLWSMF